MRLITKPPVIAKMGATELSAGDIRNALQSALSERYPRQSLSWDTTPWLTDYYPDQGAMVFTLDGKTWRLGYEISDDGAVTLATDQPTEVQQRTSYEPVQMGAFGLDVAAFASTDAEYLPWKHKIFQTGVYPGQGVDADENYLDRLVENFKPVTFKNAHAHDPQSIFSTLELGGCDRIYRDGQDLIGEGRVHQVVRMISDEPSASIEIENKVANPVLSAVALLNFPQVSDARIVASFAAFASARHSAADMQRIQDAHDSAVELGATCPIGVAAMGARHSASDMADIQAMHDLAAKQGATCKAASAQMGSRPHDPAKSAPAAAKEIRMTLTEKIKAFFGKADPKALTEAGFTPEEIKNLEAAEFAKPNVQVVTAPPTDAEAAARIKALEDQVAQQAAQFEARNEQNLDLKAKEFAADVINQRRGLPAEFEGLTRQYLNAARLDGDSGKASFGIDGNVIEGEQIKALKDDIAKKRQHALFETAIKGADSATPNGAAAERIQQAQSAIDSSIGAYNRGKN